MLQRRYWFSRKKYKGFAVTDNKVIYKPSLVFNITMMSLRLIPRGKIRTYKSGEDLYSLFCSLYKDIHPDLEYVQFIELLKVIFPTYKNPRKFTNEFKITTFGLDENLKAMGIDKFPLKTIVEKEVLKIEM